MFHVRRATRPVVVLVMAVLLLAPLLLVVLMLLVVLVVMVVLPVFVWGGGVDCVVVVDGDVYAVGGCGVAVVVVVAHACCASRAARVFYFHSMAILIATVPTTCPTTFFKAPPTLFVCGFLNSLSLTCSRIPGLVGHISIL